MGPLIFFSFFLLWNLPGVLFLMRRMEKQALCLQVVLEFLVLKFQGFVVVSERIRMSWEE
jgi:hypothetical protein